VAAKIYHMFGRNGSGGPYLPGKPSRLASTVSVVRDRRATYSLTF
jgi:hypothetical protein